MNQKVVIPFRDIGIREKTPCHNKLRILSRWQARDRREKTDKDIVQRGHEAGSKAQEFG
jgi:hypothetical protein